MFLSFNLCKYRSNPSKYALSTLDAPLSSVEYFCALSRAQFTLYLSLTHSVICARHRKLLEWCYGTFWSPSCCLLFVHHPLWSIPYTNTVFVIFIITLYNHKLRTMTEMLMMPKRLRKWGGTPLALAAVSPLPRVGTGGDGGSRGWGVLCHTCGTLIIIS